MTEKPSWARAEIAPPPVNQSYQAYEIEEETVRASFHYELPPEFFYILTGGEWNCYSGSIWEDGFTSITQAQEKKLDQMAAMMQLKPGMRVLDVGCGWGGPLVYWCHKYGVIGHGITITPHQIPEAEARAAKYGVPATFEVLHWKNLAEIETYDVITTDEVLVHFHDLTDFFAKCHKLLKPNGRMVHKELHFNHSQYSVLDAIGQHVNKVYGYTGNYLPLHKELKLLDDNDFELLHIFEIPMSNYCRTISLWEKNIFAQREHLRALVGDTVYKDFRLYLKAMNYVFSRTNSFALHIISSQKLRSQEQRS